MIYLLFLLLSLKWIVLDDFFKLRNIIEKYSKAISSKKNLYLFGYSIIHILISYLLYKILSNTNLIFLTLELFLILIIEKIRTSTIIFKYTACWHDSNSKKYRVILNLSRLIFYWYYAYILFVG